EFLWQVDEGDDARPLIDEGVDFAEDTPDLAADERELAEFGERAVGEAVDFRKPPGNLRIDIDQRNDIVAVFIDNDDRIADPRGGTQMVLDELRRIGRRGAQFSQIFGTVEIAKRAIFSDADRIAGFIAALRAAERDSRARIVEK